MRGFGRAARVWALCLCMTPAGASDPSATVTYAPRDVVVPAGSSGFSATYLEDIRPHDVSDLAVIAGSEDGQILCGGAGICACAVTNDAGTGVTMFADFPKLVLSSNVPTDASPGTAALAFSLLVPIPEAGFPQVTKVACKVTDDSGGELEVPEFTITVTGLTWTPVNSALHCVEDTPCEIDPFFVDLKDNNGGAAALSGAWFELSSTDPRMTLPTFFLTAPQLTALPTSACLSGAGCASPLSMAFHTDVNTEGTWGGATGPIVFEVTLRDSQGNRALPRGISVSIGSVNDNPTVTLNVPSIEVYYKQGGAPQGLRHTVENVVTAAAPGPATALDEAAQGFAANQPCSPEAAAAPFFAAAGVPALDLISMRNSLGWTFVDPITFGTPPVPKTLRVDCAVTDAGLASTVLNTIDIVLYPDNTPPSITADMEMINVPEITVMPVTGTHVVQNFFRASVSTPGPPGELAWEVAQGQTVTAPAGGCTLTHDCPAGSGGPCVSNFEVVPGTGTGWSLEFEPVLHATGTVTFSCLFEDSLGLQTSTSTQAVPLNTGITFTEVNTAVSGVLTRGTIHTSDAAKIAQVTVTNFLTEVRPGAPGSVSEDPQGANVAASCTTDNNAMFATPGGIPSITIPTTGTDAAPVSGTLQYTFASTAGTSTVSPGARANVVCTVSDGTAGNSGIWEVRFVIEATTGPELLLNTAQLEANEDNSVVALSAAVTPVSFPNLVTDMVDNNGGMSTFSEVNCPVSGGGAAFAAHCWYSFTSTDGRFFSSEFFQVKPYFTAPGPTACAPGALCSATLALQLADNANTGSTPLPLSLTVQDSTGNALVRTLTLVVKPVNDPPTYGAAQTSGTVMASTEELVLPFLTGVRPGPAGAADEDGQALTAQCTSNPNALFSQTPTVQFDTNTPTDLNPTAGSLRFTLTGLMVTTVTVDCSIADDAGELTTVPSFTLNIDPGPPTFTAAMTEVTAYEDNSMTATPTSVTPITRAGFLTDISDMAGGATGFPASGWYTLTSTDPRWATMFKAGPQLSAPSPAPCASACTSDLTFTLADNFATTLGNPVVFEITILNSQGLRSDPQTVHISVTGVNDVPVYTMPLGAALTVDYQPGLMVFPKFFEGILPGPVGSGEEASQSIVSGTCVLAGGLNAGMAVSPLGVTVDFTAARSTADLSFTLKDPIDAFPTPPEPIECTLRDSSGGEATAAFTVTVVNGPTEWVLPDPPEVAVNEDGRATASTAATAITIPDVVRQLRDNGEGTGAFYEMSCGVPYATPPPAAERCWYSINVVLIETNLPNVGTPFASDPVLENLRCTTPAGQLSGLCTADLTFLLQSNFVGKAQLDITVRNVHGFVVPAKSLTLTVGSVDDLPTGVLAADPLVLRATFNALDVQTRPAVVNLTAGPGEEQDWAGLTPACTHTGPAAAFTAPNGAPRLVLDAVDAASAALRFQLTGDVGPPATLKVSCILTDAMGGSGFQLPLDEFDLVIEPPTPAPPVTRAPLTDLPLGPPTPAPPFQLTPTPVGTLPTPPPNDGPVGIPETDPMLRASAEEDDDDLAWGWWLFFILVGVALCVAAAGAAYYFSVVRPKTENMNSALADRQADRYAFQHDYVAVDAHNTYTAHPMGPPPTKPTPYASSPWVH
eukprot:TRINITY_DN32384_c0_g1_i1.p1 TRINITY_DN32384_c0_g1~~TRINITY_DN32384_c0_g1_i1.p1  ORF type:complete len:1632 (+),score=425.48 TRINITY_DN32384_c0_g1_i1:74-4969(+)